MGCALAFLGSGLLLADPGELFAKRKAEIVNKYDDNDDGRLDAKERLAMRKAIIKDKANGKGRGRRGQGMIPPELIEAFDKNKDGALDESEQQKMNVEVGQRFAEMVRKYDKDGDGELKGEELSGLKEVSQAGTLKGLDAFVARFLVMQFGRAGSGEEDENGDWSQFDRDGDGLASADELAVMRHQKQKP